MGTFIRGNCMSMGQKRAIIDDEFKDEDELDTPKDIENLLNKRVKKFKSGLKKRP